jgi:RNA polymerase sigma-70 factor (ECF subfamily)
MNLMETTRLLELCRKGDTQAFEQLVDGQYSRVIHLAFSILGDQADAEEATQDVFLAVLKEFDSYRAESAFTTWLYAITVNVCRNCLKRRRSRERLMKMLQTIRPFTNESGRPIEDATATGETKMIVRQTVDKLGEKHRIPLILFYYHGFSTAEIADILGIYEGTVHSRLSTARDRLRVLLHGKLGDPSAQSKEME